MFYESREKSVVPDKYIFENKITSVREWNKTC